MSPQVHLDEMSLEARTSSASTPASTVFTAPVESNEPRKLTYGERQGIAMGWVSIALGIFLLLGGLALWASVALSAGFGGWLISMAIMGVIMVATIAAVAYLVIRPNR